MGNGENIGAMFDRKILRTRRKKYVRKGEKSNIPVGRKFRKGMIRFTSIYAICFHLGRPNDMARIYDFLSLIFSSSTALTL